MTRWVIAVTLLAFAGMAAWHWSQPWVAQASYMYYQRRCLNFTRSSEKVMYDEILISQVPMAERQLVGNENWFHFPATFPHGITFQQYTYLFDDLGKVYMAGGFVFLHGRTTPAGKLRLVQVTTHAGFPNGDQLRDVNFAYNVFTPATWKLGSKVVQASFIPPHITIRTTDHWQVYAGQIDPANLSHFTIGYAINGQRGTVEVWLTDRDSLRFHILDGPATTRPTQYFK